MSDASPDSVIATLDAETDPFKQGRTDIRPFVWGFYDGEIYRQFWNTVIDGKEIHDCTDKLFDFLEATDQKYVIYAHNGGKFDFHFFLNRLPEFSPIKVINGRAAKFKIGDHEFRDSYSLLPVPLAAYQKEKFDYTLMEPETRYEPDIAAKISEYLKSDCVYLREMITAFIDKYGLHLTMAGASLKQWEKIAERSAPRSNKLFYDRFFPYYYGGRVECFETGIIEKTFQVVDINSAYPNAMLQLHPMGTDYFKQSNPSQKTINTILSRDYLGNCFFHLDAISYGAFPWRASSDKGLYFPNDDHVREYFVTGWEMQAALKTNTIDIKKIKTIYEFDKSQCADFKNYIFKFWEERKQAKREGDVAMTLFTKLFMNSLYGKFAANPSEYKEFINVPDELKHIFLRMVFMDDNERIDYIRHRKPELYELFCDHNLFDWQYGGDAHGIIIAEKPLDEPKQIYYNVATAASITGCVRAKLWRAIHASKEPLYCDTDSIAAVSFNEIKIGNELGEWGYVECDKEKPAVDFEYAAIAARKLYAMRNKDGDWKTASKGVRLSAEEIVRVAGGEIVNYEPEAPTFSLKNEPRITSRNVKLIDKPVPLT